MGELSELHTGFVLHIHAYPASAVCNEAVSTGQAPAQRKAGSSTCPLQPAPDNLKATSSSDSTYTLPRSTSSTPKLIFTTILLPRTQAIQLHRHRGLEIPLCSTSPQRFNLIPSVPASHIKLFQGAFSSSAHANTSSIASSAVTDGTPVTRQDHSIAPKSHRVFHRSAAETLAQSLFAIQIFGE